MNNVMVPLINKRTGSYMKCSVSYFLRSFYRNDYYYYSTNFKKESDFENLIEMFKYVKETHGSLTVLQLAVFFITENEKNMPFDIVRNFLGVICTSVL